MIPALSHRNRPYVQYGSALPWRDNWENMLLEGFLLSLTPLPLFQEKGKAPFCPRSGEGLVPTFAFWVFWTTGGHPGSPQGCANIGTPRTHFCFTLWV